MKTVFWFVIILVVFSCSNKASVSETLIVFQIDMDSNKSDSGMITEQDLKFTLFSDSVLGMALNKVGVLLSNQTIQAYRDSFFLSQLNESGKTFELSTNLSAEKEAMKVLPAIIEELNAARMKQKYESYRNKIVLVENQCDSISRFLDSLGNSKTKEDKIKSREYEISEKLYSFLLEKRAHLQIEKAGVMPSVKILNGPEKRLVKN